MLIQINNFKSFRFLKKEEEQVKIFEVRQILFLANPCIFVYFLELINIIFDFT